MDEKRLRQIATSLFVAAALLIAFTALSWPSGLLPAQVVAHQDGSIPGKWAGFHPGGLVVVVGEPFEKYPFIGGPTVDVRVYNLGQQPIDMGPGYFQAISEGQVDGINDGEPPFLQGPLEPGQVRSGRLTYYGLGPLDGLRFEHGKHVVQIDFGGNHPEVGSIAEWLGAWAGKWKGEMFGSDR